MWCSNDHALSPRQINESGSPRPLTVRPCAKIDGLTHLSESREFCYYPAHLTTWLGFASTFVVVRSRPPPSCRAAPAHLFVQAPMSLRASSKTIHIGSPSTQWVRLIAEDIIGDSNDWTSTARALYCRSKCHLEFARGTFSPRPAPKRGKGAAFGWTRP